MGKRLPPRAETLERDGERWVATDLWSGDTRQVELQRGSRSSLLLIPAELEPRVRLVSEF